jgi:hypothetical protein
MERRFGLLQIERIEAFAEPSVDRRKKLAGLLPFALIAPQNNALTGGLVPVPDLSSATRKQCTAKLMRRFWSGGPFGCWPR